MMNIVKYGTGPGFVPCFTFPATRSLRVDLGTPNSLAARFTGIPRSTSSIADTIASFDHCLRFIFLVGVRRTAGADFERGSTAFSGSHDELIDHISVK